MKKTFLILSGLVLMGITSCVSQKKYDELETRYRNTMRDNARLKLDSDALAKLKVEHEQLLKDKSDLEFQKYQLESELKTLKENHAGLKKDYDALLAKNSSDLQANAAKSKEMLDQLEKTRKELDAKQSALAKTESDLKAKIDRINELEKSLSEQKLAVQKLKDGVKNALKAYEGKGLTVQEKDGRVYISVENKLLFESGKWDVNPQGTQALKEVATVLKNESDLNVLIEGHTDTVPFNGLTAVKDNWDLSVMRATSITKVLQQNGLSPQQITAAGRSEYFPVADNETAEGKAKNRRVEIILTPNYSEVMKLLN